MKIVIFALLYRGGSQVFAKPKWKEKIEDREVCFEQENLRKRSRKMEGN